MLVDLQQKTNLNPIKKYAKIDFCGVIMLSKNIKIITFTQYHKTIKTPATIYADLESSIKKVHGCKDNPEKSYTTKAAKHIPSGFSLSNIWAFDGIKAMNYICRGKDCIKKFSKSLKEHTMEIINFEKRK